MKILYIHQYFITPDIPGATRSYWVAQELIKNGHEVTMITTGLNKEKKIERENENDINVIYLRMSETMEHDSIFNRLIYYFEFAIKSTMVALKEKNVDLVISTSTPLTVGIPALILKWFKNFPYVFEVRDLWPEVPIQMGGLKNKLSIYLAYLFEKTIYNSSEHIIALSPGMYEGILAKKIPQNKISMIPNMSKIDEFTPKEKDFKLINKMGLQAESFKVVYFGSMGLANGIDYILEAAKLLLDYRDIEFIFLGGGGMEEELISKCKNENIKNINFFGHFPLKELTEIVSFCDVSLVTFLNIPILSTNSPNKFFDSLSAGKTIIVNSNGWTKDLVEEYNCGLYVNPENSQDLADKIVYLKDNPELCKEMGNNSRALAETRFDKSILCKEFGNVIESLKIKIRKKI